jgi:hypothetical protein
MIVYQTSFRSEWNASSKQDIHHCHHFIIEVIHRSIASLVTSFFCCYCWRAFFVEFIEIHLFVLQRINILVFCIDQIVQHAIQFVLVIQNIQILGFLNFLIE